MERNIIDFLDNTEKENPDGIAFVDAARRISFRDLRVDAIKIADAIINSESRIDAPVVLFMDDDIESIVSYFGVAYSGNYFCFLNHRLPDAYCKDIIERLNPAAVITKEVLRGRPNAFCKNINIIVYEEATKNTKDVAELQLRNPSEKLCVIFTSGSTGKPKGVVITNSSAIKKIYAHIDMLPEITKEDVFADQFPLSSVSSLPNILLSVKMGITNHIVIKNSGFDVAKSIKRLEQAKVTMFFSSVGFLKLADKYDVLPKEDDKLRIVYFGGEVAPIKTISRWRKALPKARYLNCYGSTETIAACMYYYIDREFGEDENFPIGHPLSDSDIFIKDDSGNDVTVGELQIRSDAIAAGYYDKQGGSLDSFTKDIYGIPIYKMGDIVRKNERGEIEYVGRKDHQIKINGFRVELAEVEREATRYPESGECCCIYDNDKKELLLFYTGKAFEMDILRYMKEHLPSYMIPSRLIRIELLPYTASGKVDRLGLKEWI